MARLITPGKNSKLWKEWRAIGRGKDERFFMEHREAVLETLGGGNPPRQILLAGELYRQEPAYWDGLVDESGINWFLLPGEQLDRLISIRSSSGLCGVYAPGGGSLDDLPASPFLLVGWEIQDPGNVGTIIRSVIGLTGGGVLLVGGCNPWSAKVARSSAGALLQGKVRHVPRSQGAALLKRIEDLGFRLFSTTPRAGRPLDEIEWSGRDAVIVGNESHGVPPDLVARGSSIRLTLRSGVESLNVSVFAGIVAYQWGTLSPSRS